MAPHKINIKDRLSDGEIDLSMSDLQEVPVKDISVYKKAVSLDLSNNHLKTLPVTFVTLTHLTKLDLSKNQLTELPENFGDLIKLKYLDLYQNQLQYLPLSFNKLKALKWLDLKDNPLVPAVAKVAGPCLDAKQCQTCAKEVVNFFTLVQEQITTDLENRQKQRQKQQQVNQTKDMDNKKSKKKEKTKQKKENGVIKDKKPKTTNKNNRKSNQNFKQKEKKSGFFKSIIALIIFFVLLLFVLTSVKFKYTVGIEDFCKQVYKAGSEMLPPNLQVYSTMISGFVKSAHDHVGNATIRTFHFVTNSENYSQVYNTVLYYVESFKEQYKSYVS